MRGKHVILKKKKRKITYSAGGGGAEIDFVLVRKKEDIRGRKSDSMELHYRLMVVDLVKDFQKLL